MSPERRSHDEYVGAAQAALRAHGSVGGGWTLSMSGAATALGLPRSTLYRRWTSVAGLGEDLAVHAATHRDDWQHQLVAQPPSDVATAVARAVRAARPDAGPSFRAAISALPATSPARAAVARWEGERIAGCASWLASAHGGRTDAAWTDVAVSLTALVEGTLLLAALDRPGSSEPDALPAPVVDDLDRVAGTVVARLASAMAGPDRPLGRPAPTAAAPAGPPAHVELLDRLVDALDDGAAAAAAISAPARLIDLDRLARHLGVSPRRLYAVWPNVADLNGDLIVASLRAHRAEVEELTLATVSVALTGRYGRFRDLFISVFRAIIEQASPTSGRDIFACSFGVEEAAVRDRVRGELGDWLLNQEVALLALLQLIGRHLRPTTDPKCYAGAVFGATLGAERLAVLHPQLLDRHVDYLGDQHPTLAVGAYAMLTALTEGCQHGTLPDDVRHRAAPPRPEP